MQIGAVGGTWIGIEYSTLPGNQPRTYHNFVAVWEASVIPWNAPPLVTYQAGLDDQVASVVVGGLIVTGAPYIVGYGVAPGITGICASALVQAGALISPPSSVRIGIDSVGTTSLSVRYETLQGYLPKTYRNHVELYPGYASPFNPPPVIATVPVGSDSTVGNVYFNNVQLDVGLPYTVVYRMSDDATWGATSAAAVLTFETAPHPNAA